MISLNLKKGIIQFELSIDKVKYCLGNNFQQKYVFKQLLLEYVNNVKPSEYAIDNTGKVQLTINNKKITPKEIKFYYVDHNYSITNDLKLTTKSLIASYLETIMSENYYIDTIKTVNIMLEAFAMELDDEIIKSRFVTYTPKLFLKIIAPLFFLQDYQANEYDLSYDEIIIIQLKMIKFISDRNSTVTHICLIELPRLTIEINEYIKQINNCIIIVLLWSYNSILETKDVFLFDKQILDLNDEEALYNLFVDKGIFTIMEAKEYMNNLLKSMSKLDSSILK